MSKLRQAIKPSDRVFSVPFDEKMVSPNPIKQFEVWMQDAIRAEVDEIKCNDTCDCRQKGQPDARVVLLRDVTKSGFSFFTNYLSKKGKDMSASKKVCLNFYWIELGRQVRVLGTIEKLPAAQSNEYFHSRPRESQLGAWGSHQSEELLSRELLIERFKQLEEKYKNKKYPDPLIGVAIE